MIKKYKLFKESLLDHLKGPTEEEIIKNFEDNPDKFLEYSINNEYLRGVKIALDNGADPCVDNYRLFLYKGKHKEEIIELLFEYSNIPKSENNIIKLIFNNIEQEYSNTDVAVRYKNKYGVLFYFIVFGDKYIMEIPSNVYYLFFHVYNKSKQEIIDLLSDEFNLPDFAMHVTTETPSSFKIKKTLYDYTIGLNESLLDHLKGPLKGDVVKGLDDDFRRNKIGLNSYIYKCKENDIEPNKKLVFDYLEIDKSINNMDEYFDYLLSSLEMSTKEINDKVKDNTYDNYYFGDYRTYYMYKNNTVIVINEIKNECVVSYDYFRFVLNMFGVYPINEILDIIREKLLKKGIIDPSYSVDMYSDLYLRYI